MKVLTTEDDFYDLTKAYFDKMAAQNVVHTEIFFDPQAHTARGLPFEAALNGITRGRDYGREKLGISSFLIMNFLRDEDPADAMRTLEQALPHKHLIKAVGLEIRSSATHRPCSMAFFSGHAKKDFSPSRMPEKKARPPMCGRR